MITHIVFFKLKDHAEGGTKAENAQKAKEILEALKDKIEQIISIEVGINFNKSDAAFDISLYSQFATKEDLDIYQKHPEHLKVAQFIRKVMTDKAVVDYK